MSKKDKKEGKVPISQMSIFREGNEMRLTLRSLTNRAGTKSTITFGECAYIVTHIQ